MRRALLLLALVLLPAIAEAKVAIVHMRDRRATQNTAGYAAQPGDYKQWSAWTTTHVVGFLNRYGRRLGIDYDIYTPEQVRTSLAGVGSIQGQTYTAVIWSGVTNQVTGATNPLTSCYPCSLSLVAYAPSVPQLMIHNGEGENFPGAPSVSCSLAIQAAFDPESQGPGFGNAVIGVPGLNAPFHRGWSIGSQHGTIAQLPSGGSRTVIGIQRSISFHNRDSTQNSSFVYDALGMVAGFDSASTLGWHVWERLNQHKSGMAPIIVCNWATAAQTRMLGLDSGGELGPNINGDPMFIYFALAHLDSMIGGDMLGTTDPEPVRFAIQIEGVAARSSATTDGGMAPHDTSVVWASLDSIASLRVPVAFGVNTDSICCYLGDIIHTRSVGSGKFTPWNRAGLDTAVLTSATGRAHPFHVVDMLGRWRNRPYVTPFSQTQADSSVRNLAQWSRWRIDSIFGGSRFDGMVMAPGNDWSPKNLTNVSGDRDSLFYALSLAGYSGIAKDVEADTINTTGSTNPVGLSVKPYFSRVRYGDGVPFGVVGFTRLSNTGSLEPWHPTNLHFEIMGHNIRRLWMSAYTGDMTIHDKANMTRETSEWTIPELSTPYVELVMARVSPTIAHGPGSTQTVNILRTSMAGLGSGDHGVDAPARPGWWAIKSLANQVRTLNYLAGRNLAQIVYPGQLGPTDLR